MAEPGVCHRCGVSASRFSMKSATSARDAQASSNGDQRVGEGVKRANLLLIAALVSALLSPESGEAGETWTWGVAVGSPQTIAATLEKRTDSPVRIQGHAGTLLVASSLGIRVLALPWRGGFAPYAFLGAGIFNIVEGDGGGAMGTTGYGWGGVGFRLPTRGLTWFAELGFLWGMNEDKGYESPLPGLAIGVGFGAP